MEWIKVTKTRERGRKSVSSSKHSLPLASRCLPLSHAKQQPQEERCVVLRTRSTLPAPWHRCVRRVRVASSRWRKANQDSGNGPADTPDDAKHQHHVHESE